MFQINMEAVTSQNYDVPNQPQNYNHNGYNGYNYSQIEDKHKSQFVKYSDEYSEYGKNSVRLSAVAKANHRNGLYHQYQQNKMNLNQYRQENNQGLITFKQRYNNSRSQSQPERQQYQNLENSRSKSQDSRDVTIYQIDPPVRYEVGKSHQRSMIPLAKKKDQLVFYEIENPMVHEKMNKDSKSEKMEKRDNKLNGNSRKQMANGNINHQEHQNHHQYHHQHHPKSNGSVISCQPDESPLPNFAETQKCKQTNDRISKHQEPSQYSEVLKKNDDSKQIIQVNLFFYFFLN